ncbi:MAG: fibronectin type III domain-containing protein, partial [Promethearchaeota archaeon]
LEASYDADRNVEKVITVCAYDPEGDEITSITLSNEPSGMTIEATDPADANCRVIRWTPTECGDYDDIQVTASDATGSNTQTFSVNILNCPPSKPNVSISPSSPGTLTDITCEVTPSSVKEPDGVDTITLLFEWFEVDGGSETHIAGADKSTTFNAADSDTYRSTLVGSTYTSKLNGYLCKVTASDKDGSAEVATTSTVTVVNTPPSAPASAAITPANTADTPKTDQALTCTITEASTPDADGDTVQYKYVWSTTGGKTYPPTPGYTASLTHELPASETEKGDVWSCTVTAYDETVESTTSTTSSNSVTIRNTPPETPDGATVAPASPTTTQDLTCTVTPDATVDADAGDVASIRYEYVWKCAGKSDVTHGPKTGTTDTLVNDSTVVKGDSWSCEVRAVDSSDAPSAGVATSNAVTIVNTAPTGLAVHVEPDPNAYDSQDLTCTVTTVPTDPDVAEGDTIQYKYEWKKDGSVMVTHPFSANTTDTLENGETSQGDTWTCTVTAKDSSDAQDSATSNAVLIYNRFPTITINTSPSPEPEGLEQVWEIGVAYTIEVTVDDPDGNAFTLEVDPNYTDPNDAEVKDWLTFDLTATPATISGTPPESAAESVLIFKFVVEETDGNPIRKVEKSINVTILTPETIVDDFEYPSSKPALSDNGWYRLQGSGKMLLNSETLPDETINHYLRTELNKTPSNNSQLNYIIVKELPDNVFTMPCMSFFIKDSNMYYIDFYVRAEKDGKERTFVIRYAPQDDADTYTGPGSGIYVTWKIGADKINSDGVKVSRSLYDDLFIPTGGYRLLYLDLIVVRGDVDYLDDIVVKSCGPIVPPKDVKNLAAQGNENQVTLTWTLDSEQVDAIAGYRIYMDTAGTPAKVPAKLVATVDPNTTSKTIKQLNNGITYYFLVTAFDNTSAQQETAGKAVSGTPQATTPLDPADLKAESINGSIKLSWKNPHGQHADLAGYIIFFKDCAGVACGTIREEAVAATSADANVPFVYFITHDANNQPLVSGQQYNFTVKAIDGASPPNLSSGVAVSITLSVPTSLVIDNFDLNYGPNDKPGNKGWFKLQGKGTFGLLSEDGDNYLNVASTQTGASGLKYIITKLLENPEKYDKPKFRMRLRSAGYFRFDIYLKGTDNKNYFLGFIGDPATEEDAGTFTKEATRWYKTTLGWKNKDDGKFHEINLDLNDALQAAAGVGFKHLLGIICRGRFEVDDIEVNIGTPDPQNLTARPADGEVLLSWTVPETADPNTIDKTMLYIDSVLEDGNMAVERIQNTKDYKYTVTGLTNGQEYDFTVTFVINSEESNGVTVSATPRAFKTTTYTFDDAGALTVWSSSTALTWEYDAMVQSGVMFLNPAGDYPDRVYVSTNMSVDAVTGITCRIRTNTNFVIWLIMSDNIGPLRLGLVPGGTKGDHFGFSDIYYYFL